LKKKGHAFCGIVRIGPKYAREVTAVLVDAVGGTAPDHMLSVTDVGVQSILHVAT